MIEKRNDWNKYIQFFDFFTHHCYADLRSFRFLQLEHEFPEPEFVFASKERRDKIIRLRAGLRYLLAGAGVKCAMPPLEIEFPLPRPPEGGFSYVELLREFNEVVSSQDRGWVDVPLEDTRKWEMDEVECRDYFGRICEMVRQESL